MQKNTTTIYTNSVQTPLGEMLAATTENGICLLEFTDSKRLEWQIAALQKNYSAEIKQHRQGKHPLLKQLDEQLQAYFSAELKEFELPLDSKGTEFQMQVWDALLTIPYAETRCYQEQATAIGKPRAFRAVASANRNNRIGIIIPCHRVIAKNGSLAGYGGGLQRKAFLLELEKNNQ